MKNINFFKKYKLFRFFKKTLNNNKVELEMNYGIRVDSAYRIYTVLNIPEELIGEAYSLRKSDIDRISESYIKEYSKNLNNFINSIGLGELCEFYKIEKVDKYSYLLVLGFSLFKSNEWYDKLYFRYIPILSLSAIITSILIYFL